MTATLTYELIETIPSAGVYQVTFTVLNAIEIDPAIFVFDSGTMLFTGVATLYDMRTWPSTPDSDLMSYRATIVTRAFTDPSDAFNFAAYTRARIEWLRRDWQAYIDSFTATQIITTPEP